MTLTVLRSTSQIFYKCPSIVFCLVFFSSLDGSYGSQGGRPQRWSAILNTSFPGHRQSTWLITNNVNLKYLVKVMFYIFLHFKITSPSFPYCTLWKQVTKYTTHEWVETYVLPPLEENISIKLFEIILYGKLVSTFSFNTFEYL